MKGFLLTLLCLVLFAGGFWLGSGVPGKCVRNLSDCFDCLDRDSPVAKEIGLERCLWVSDAKRHVEDFGGAAAGAIEGAFRGLTGKPR